MKEITELLTGAIKNKDFPGVAYAIVYPEKIDFDFIGYKEIDPEKIPIKQDVIYDCASLTKVCLTTSMIMKLIEDKKIYLEQKVSDILTKFKHNNITIKDLLIHSSGLPADISKAYELRNKEDIEEKIYNYELIYEPGKKVVYSDIGFILLGFIIEKITNKKLSQYAREVVSDPLNMSDTSYHPNIDRVAPTEFRNDDVYQGLLRGKVHDEKAFALQNEAGHAGMFSTIFDLAKLIRSIMLNDELILKKETVDLLFETQIIYKESDRRVIARSLGWEKPTGKSTAGDNADFNNVILHTGFTGCNIWIDRFKKIGFVMLSNAVHPKRSMNGIIKYRNQIANIILATNIKVAKLK